MLTVTTTGGARKRGEGMSLQQEEETQSLVCNAGLRWESCELALASWEALQRTLFSQSRRSLGTCEWGP